MVKSGPNERAAGNEQSRMKGTPNTSKLLKNSGISFSKVSKEAASVQNSPVTKPVPPRSLSSLKGLNISLSKPGGDDEGAQSSDRGEGAMTAPKQASLSRSLALVPATDAQEEHEEPKSPLPQVSSQAKKRGPPSKRKAPLPQSNKLSFAKKVPKESDEKLLEEGSAGGESLSLTFQADQDSEAHSVSIPVEDNVLKELSFNSALDLGSMGGTGESVSYESLLSRVSSELDSITKTNKQDKEKIELQSDEKLLL